MDPTIEGPLQLIRRPPYWSTWLAHYTKRRFVSYDALQDKMQEVTNAEFESLKILTVKSLRKKAWGRSKTTLTNAEWLQLKDEIIKQCPKMSCYKDAWPIRAIAAKYAIYRREREENKKSTQTRRKCKYVYYIGKPLSRVARECPTNEAPLMTPARRISPEIISTQPSPSAFGSVRDVPSPIHHTHIASKDSISAEEHLPFQPRKMQCIKCGHLAPLSEQAKSQRLFTKYISTIYHAFDNAEETLTKMGIIDDYTLALLLQHPEEDRRRMFTTSAYCNVVDGIEISRYINTLKHEMQAESSPARPPFSSASASWSQSRASSSRTRPPASYPSYSSSSDPATTSFTMKCNACDFQPQVTPCSPMLEAFLAAKGLHSLLPAFIEWAINTDERFEMLRYSWNEADRAVLFDDDRHVKLTAFHRFALMMAFRQRD